MKTTVRSVRGIVGAIVLGAILAAPHAAFAQSASVLTKQVLPIGGNSCTPLFVSEVTPYIYDGELHSFDVVLSDRSYVGVFGQAGNVEIPFNYMTRRMEGATALRLHVDTTVAVPTSIPVVLTLLSSTGTSSVICLSTVAFTVGNDGTVTAEVPTTIPVPGTSNGGDTGSSGSTGSSSGTTGGKSGGKTNGQVKGSTATTGTTSATSTSIGEVIGKMCSENGAYQLWFILLAIFFVISAFVGLSQPPLTNRHGALPAVLIGIPFAILMLLWYFVPDCRLSWMIPLILIVAAAIGLYSAYRTSAVMRPATPASTTLAKSEEKKPENKA